MQIALVSHQYRYVLGPERVGIRNNPKGTSLRENNRLIESSIHKGFNLKEDYTLKNSLWLATIIAAVLSMPLASYGQTSFPCPPVKVHLQYCDHDHSGCDTCNANNRLDIFDFGGGSSDDSGDEKQGVFDYLALYAGYNSYKLSNDLTFSTVYVGAELNFYGPFGIFYEQGIGADMNYRQNFQLPVRSTYKDFGIRASFEEGLFRTSGSIASVMLEDVVRLGSLPLDVRPGESYQSVENLLTFSARVQYSVLYVEGSLGVKGDYLLNNIASEVSAQSISVGVTAGGFIKTFESIF